MAAPYIAGDAQANNGKDVSSLNIQFATAGGANDPDPPVPNAVEFVWIAVVYINDALGSGITLTTPSGWTRFINAVGSSFNKVYAYYKAYDGSSGSVNFAASAECGKMHGWMVLVGGASTASPNPVTQSTAQATGPTSNHSTGSVTPDHADSLLIAAFGSPDTPAQFSTPVGMTSFHTATASGSLGTFGLQAASVAHPTASAVSKSSTSFQAGNPTYSVNGLAALISVNPSQQPSAPVLTKPNGGESYVAGVTVNITWTQSTSPVVAQGSIKYHIQYSTNSGSTWTDVVSLTSAGVGTYAWSTSGLATGTQYRIRIRATGDNGANFGPYDTSDANFSLISETTPGPPTGLNVQQPAGTTITAPSGYTHPPIDRTSGIRIGWTHAGGETNPQTTYTGEWSYNADMSSPTSFSPGTGTNQFHDFAGATFNHGAIVYVRVRTTGLTLQSAFSSTFSFIASTKPAVNITAPTAGVPPSSSFPTITISITTGDMRERRYRYTQSGNQVFDSGFVLTTQLSFVSGYSLANGVAYMLLVSIRNQYGLASAEDSETFTPNFTAPAQPALTAEALDDEGCIQLTMVNSDSPSYNQLFRDGVLIADALAVDAVFRDFNVKSGVEYSYVARAVNATGINDSDAETATLTLSALWLHSLTQTSATSNATVAVALLNQSPQGYSRRCRYGIMRKRGTATRPQIILGSHKQQRLPVIAQMVSGDSALDDVKAIYAANGDVCGRTQFGSLVFGRMRDLNISETDEEVLTVSFTVEETDYEEDLEVE